MAPNKNNNNNNNNRVNKSQGPKSSKGRKLRERQYTVRLDLPFLQEGLRSGRFTKRGANCYYDEKDGEYLNVAEIPGGVVTPPRSHYAHGVPQAQPQMQPQYGAQGAVGVPVQQQTPAPVYQNNFAVTQQQHGYQAPVYFDNSAVFTQQQQAPQPIFNNNFAVSMQQMPLPQAPPEMPVVAQGQQVLPTGNSIPGAGVFAYSAGQANIQQPTPERTPERTFNSCSSYVGDIIGFPSQECTVSMERAWEESVRIRAAEAATRLPTPESCQGGMSNGMIDNNIAPVVGQGSMGEMPQGNASFGQNGFADVNMACRPLQQAPVVAQETRLQTPIVTEPESSSADVNMDVHANYAPAIGAPQDVVMASAPPAQFTISMAPAAIATPEMQDVEADFSADAFYANLQAVLDDFLDYS